MLSRLRLVTVIFCTTFFLLGAAFGQKAAIEANVTGVDGRPARTAEVRIERQDKKMAPVIVKTNWRGHLSATNLEVGTYKLTATVAGGVQSSQVVKTRAQPQPLLVTFDLQKVPAMKSKGKKRMVYMPAQTGSRVGGGWVEVSDDGSPASSNGQNVDTMSGSSLQRLDNHAFSPPATGGR